MRMHHLGPEEAVPHVAARPHARTLGQLLGLAAVEIEEAHGQLPGLVGNRHHQLPPRPVLHLAGRDHAFHLRRHRSKGRFADRHDARLVFIAHRQVQYQVGIRAQTELVQLVAYLVGPRGGGLILLGCFDGFGHARIILYENTVLS